MIASLTMNINIDDITLKLIRDNAVLNKVRDYVNLKIEVTLEFQKQFIMSYLSDIFIMHALYGN